MEAEATFAAADNMSVADAMHGLMHRNRGL